MTVWRWALRGVKGVQLRTGCIGGTRRYTTEAWYADFCDAVTAARSGKGALVTTSRQQESAIKRAEAELRPRPANRTGPLAPLTTV